MGSFGVAEITFVLVVLLFLFGAKRIPLIARGLGEGIRNFKTGFKDQGDESDHTLSSGEEPRDG